MQQIFEFLRTAIDILVGMIQGMYNAVQTLANTKYILDSWLVYVPQTVSAYIGLGVLLTIVLVILGRANK